MNEFSLIYNVLFSQKKINNVPAFVHLILIDYNEVTNNLFFILHFNISIWLFKV